MPTENPQISQQQEEKRHKLLSFAHRADNEEPLSFERILAEEYAVLRGIPTPESVDIEELQKKMQNDERFLTALCISGGGIRSATFALGALQGLADLGILEHFDYLSTVSGGGYIGSWLSAWRQRKQGIRNVVPKLQSFAPIPKEGELDPIQHLREYNNYLSPKLGFFSADTWTLVATVARNMLLNWLVFIPLLMFALMLPRIVLSLARLSETYKNWYDPGVGKLLDFLNIDSTLPIAAAVLLAIGVFNALRYLPGLGKKDPTQAQFLKYCQMPIVLSALALLTLDAWFPGGDRNNPAAITFRQYFLWISSSGLAGCALYLAWSVFQSKKNDENIKTGKWKAAGGLLIAVALASASMSGGAVLLGELSTLSWAVYVTVALPLLLLSFSLAVTVFVGFTSRRLKDEDREWLARAGAWMLLCILTWLGLCALALLAPNWVFEFHGWIKSEIATGAIGGISGIVAAFSGFSNKTNAKKPPEKNGSQPATSSSGKVLDIAGKIAAPVFIVVFLTYLAVLTNFILVKVNLADGPWNNHYLLLENTYPDNAILFAFACLAFSWLMARFININKFSLHAMYRERIIKAYLGASNEDSKAANFTGFAENDNLAMTKLTDLRAGEDNKPFHIVNIALNLVAGKRLAWQQRKAESFTVSPLHCGYDRFYRRTGLYGGKEGGISLGTAITISGAAASPNMGYHSSPALAFIMTLFNARLGAWLGNPKAARTWKDEGPKSAFNSIVREAFGLTDDTSPYVYLSDGGHFENLGLYEMIRRRCRYIVLLDGTGDPDYRYEDLANAVRKIRIDQKVPIRFRSPLPLSAKPQHRCMIADICYDELDVNLRNGYLIYLKPDVIKTDPADVAGYKAAHNDFPHETTANQWFNESQTESYRMLGLCTVTDVFKPWDATGFQSLVNGINAYVALQPDQRADIAAAQRRSLAQQAARDRATAKAEAARVGSQS